MGQILPPLGRPGRVRRYGFGEAFKPRHGLPEPVLLGDGTVQIAGLFRFTRQSCFFGNICSQNCFKCLEIRPSQADLSETYLA